MSIFEVIMLLCFGAAWPFSIRKSLVTGQNAGKSLIFLIIVFVGYLAGITHKLLYNRDIVTVFYLLNASMVLIDIFVFLRNSRRAVS